MAQCTFVMKREPYYLEIYTPGHEHAAGYVAGGHRRRTGSSRIAAQTSRTVSEAVLGLAGLQNIAKALTTELEKSRPATRTRNSSGRGG